MSSVVPDLKIGERFGQLEIIEYLPDHTDPSGRRRQRIRVRCDCGITYDLNDVGLRRGKATRCRSCAHDKTNRYRVGDRYDKLVVQKFWREGVGSRRRMALCLCDCGKTLDVFVGLLGRNKNHNCGCTPLRTYQGCGNLSGAYFQSLRSGAKKRGLTFNLTKEHLWTLFLRQDSRCALTGYPLSLHIRDRQNGTASVDRINSDMGYEMGNVQWVHKDINKMKQGFKQSRLLELCRRIVEYHDGTATRIPMTEAPPPRKRIRPPGRKDFGPRLKPTLSVERILNDADKFFARHQRFPGCNENEEVPDHPEEKWSAYDTALRMGLRGLMQGSSLPRLLKKHRGMSAKIGRKPKTRP